MITATVVILTPFAIALLLTIAIYRASRPVTVKGYWKYYLLAMLLGLLGAFLLLSFWVTSRDFIWLGIVFLGVALAGAAHGVHIVLIYMPEKWRKRATISLVAGLSISAAYGLYVIGYAFTHIQCKEVGGKYIPQLALSRVFRDNQTNLPLCVDVERK